MTLLFYYSYLWVTRFSTSNKYAYSHMFLSWIPTPSRSILTSKPYVTSSLKLWNWLLFFIKTLFGFCLPNHCLSFTVLSHLLFWLPSLSRSKSNLVYCLHPLKGWAVLEVLAAVISIGGKEGKFQVRKRTVKHFLLFPLFLSCILLLKGRIVLAAESRTQLRGWGNLKGLSPFFFLRQNSSISSAAPQLKSNTIISEKHC